MKLHSNNLFNDLKDIIEQGKQQVNKQVNSTLTLVYWQVGHRVNKELLKNKRAEYGKEIISQIATNLVSNYGNGFTIKNLHRMIQFAQDFEEIEIVVTLSRQLSWSHFLLLIPIKTKEAKKYYSEKIIEEQWSVRETRRQIERKAFERQELASIQLSETNSDIQSSFKDPYLLDFLGIKDGYLENDLESAILKELENFILELGKGFAFIERQKRMIIDGEDFYLDLLFFNRKLKRLVAVELKIGKFKAAHKGQMELYLKWLERQETQEDENSPIGLIICAEKSNEQIELLEMGKDGIMVAEYWTELPPKALLEKKLQEALIEAKERIEKKKLIQ